MLPILEGKPDGGGINSLSLAEVSCVSAATPLSWVSATGAIEPEAESAVLLSEPRSLLAAYSNSIWVVVLRRAWGQMKTKLPFKHAMLCV